MGKHSKREDLAFWAEEPVSAEAPPKSGKRRKKTEVLNDAKEKTEVKYTRRKRRKPKISWWSAPVTAVMGCILFVIVAAFFMSTVQYSRFRAMRQAVETDRFYPGIAVNGVDMSGKTLEGALGEWAAQDEAQKSAYVIEIAIGGKEWLLTPDDIEYKSDYLNVLKSAWSVGRYGTLSQRYGVIEKTAGAWARSYEVTGGANEVKLAERLDAIALAASEPGTAAKITGFDPATKGFSFEEGTEGLAVDARELKSAVEKAHAEGGGAITVERRTVKPSQTVESLKKTFGLVASTKTSAKSSSSNRLTNLRLACEALNGLRLEPGETFSFNETLGKRTADKGYKQAPAVSGGAHTMQIGGGICQVATTLFNSVAKAGLKIVKRYPHTIPSTYVARGLDATVNWPNQDFKFKNDTDYPIYLAAGVTKDKQVIVEVHGKKLDEGIEIKLKGETEGRTAAGEPKYVMVNDLPTGQTRTVESKRSGYQMITYRLYFKDGKQVEKERLFKSNYPSSGGIVEVGR